MDGSKVELLGKQDAAIADLLARIEGFRRARDVAKDVPLEELLGRCERVLKFHRGDTQEPKVHFGESVLLPVGGGGM